MSGDEIQRLSKELDELKKAGGMLAEAATHVVTHYDGVHRLRLALAHWHKTMADEFGRGSMAEKPLLAEAPAQSSAQISKRPASAKDTVRRMVPKVAETAIRGHEFGWLYIDECRDMSREAWDVLLGRLRCR